MRAQVELTPTSYLLVLIAMIKDYQRLLQVQKQGPTSATIQASIDRLWEVVNECSYSLQNSDDGLTLENLGLSLKKLDSSLNCVTRELESVSPDKLTEDFSEQEVIQAVRTYRKQQFHLRAAISQRAEQGNYSKVKFLLTHFQNKLVTKLSRQDELRREKQLAGGDPTEVDKTIFYFREHLALLWESMYTGISKTQDDSMDQFDPKTITDFLEILKKLRSHRLEVEAQYSLAKEMDLLKKIIQVESIRKKTEKKHGDTKIIDAHLDEYRYALLELWIGLKSITMDSRLFARKKISRRRHLDKPSLRKAYTLEPNFENIPKVEVIGRDQLLDFIDQRLAGFVMTNRVVPEDIKTLVASALNAFEGDFRSVQRYKHFQEALNDLIRGNTGYKGQLSWMYKQILEVLKKDLEELATREEQQTAQRRLIDEIDCLILHQGTDLMIQMEPVLNKILNHTVEHLQNNAEEPDKELLQKIDGYFYMKNSMPSDIENIIELLAGLEGDLANIQGFGPMAKKVNELTNTLLKSQKHELTDGDKGKLSGLVNRVNDLVPSLRLDQHSANSVFKYSYVEYTEGVDTFTKQNFLQTSEAVVSILANLNNSKTQTIVQQFDKLRSKVDSGQILEPDLTQVAENIDRLIETLNSDQDMPKNLLIDSESIEMEVSKPSETDISEVAQMTISSLIREFLEKTQPGSKCIIKEPLETLFKNMLTQARSDLKMTPIVLEAYTKDFEQYSVGGSELPRIKYYVDTVQRMLEDYKDTDGHYGVVADLKQLLIRLPKLESELVECENVDYEDIQSYHGHIFQLYDELEKHKSELIAGSLSTDEIKSMQTHLKHQLDIISEHIEQDEDDPKFKSKILNSLADKYENLGNSKRVLGLKSSKFFVKSDRFRKQAELISQTETDDLVIRPLPFPYETIVKLINFVINKFGVYRKENNSKTVLMSINKSVTMYRGLLANFKAGREKGDTSNPLQKPYRYYQKLVQKILSHLRSLEIKMETQTEFDSAIMACLRIYEKLGYPDELYDVEKLEDADSYVQVLSCINEEYSEIKAALPLQRKYEVDFEIQADLAERCLNRMIYTQTALKVRVVQQEEVVEDYALLYKTEILDQYQKLRSECQNLGLSVNNIEKRIQSWQHRRSLKIDDGYLEVQQSFCEILKWYQQLKAATLDAKLDTYNLHSSLAKCKKKLEFIRKNYNRHHRPAKLNWKQLANLREILVSNLRFLISEKQQMSEDTQELQKYLNIYKQSEISEQSTDLIEAKQFVEAYSKEISKFVNIEGILESNPKDPKFVKVFNNLLSNFEFASRDGRSAQVLHILETMASFNKKFGGQNTEAISDIVRFYSSKKPNKMSLDDFFQFCQDFGLIQTQSKILENNEITEIFAKHSNKNVMESEELTACLQSLARVYLGREYDKVHNSQFRDLSSQEKLQKLHCILGLHDGTYKEKLGSVLKGHDPSRILSVPAESIRGVGTRTSIQFKMSASASNSNHGKPKRQLSRTKELFTSRGPSKLPPVEDKRTTQREKDRGVNTPQQIHKNGGSLKRKTKKNPARGSSTHREKFTSPKSPRDLKPLIKCNLKEMKNQGSDTPKIQKTSPRAETSRKNGSRVKLKSIDTLRAKNTQCESRGGNYTPGDLRSSIKLPISPGLQRTESKSPAMGDKLLSEYGRTVKKMSSKNAMNSPNTNSKKEDFMNRANRMIEAKYSKDDKYLIKQSVQQTSL